MNKGAVLDIGESCYQFWSSYTSEIFSKDYNTFCVNLCEVYCYTHFGFCGDDLLFCQLIQFCFDLWYSYAICTSWQRISAWLHIWIYRSSVWIFDLNWISYIRTFASLKKLSLQVCQFATFASRHTPGRKLAIK